MNTPDNTDQVGDHADHTSTDSRPLGYWLRVVDGLITHEFATAFEDEHVDRRDWMLLNVVSGDVRDPRLTERLARKGKGPHKGRRLSAMAERGWIVADAEGTWTLTDEGRAAHERLGGIVDGVRSRVAGAVSPEDFATTLSSLEAIARELGWDEQAGVGGRGPFGRGGFGRRGFGRGGHRRGGHGHDHGHGAHGHHGRGWQHRPGFAPGLDAGDHGCADHADRGRRHGGGHHHEHGHNAELAFERGFEAGFAQSRESRDS